MNHGSSEMAKGKTILELLESARFFYKSKFPVLFCVFEKLEKSAEKIDIKDYIYRSKSF